MSTVDDITNEKRSATKGAYCRTESEKQTAHGRAKVCGSAQKTEPEPDYDEEGIVPHD